MNAHIFGPVPSRRLGRSLGVDLVPFKTCTYDCIYCQLGPTTCRTVQRREWVPVDLLLQELRGKLDTHPDYITLSGSGEPTLFTPLDKLIEGILALTDTPIAVLTNGSLLGHPEVQRELALADLAIPSLDAGNEATFRRVNRPDEGISFDRMLAGLIDFRHRFPKPYWLEVFLLGGYTDSERELADIRRCVEQIQPDRVQLNTVTRPPCRRLRLDRSTGSIGRDCRNILTACGGHRRIPQCPGVEGRRGQPGRSPRFAATSSLLNRRHRRGPGNAPE